MSRFYIITVDHSRFTFESDAETPLRALTELPFIKVGGTMFYDLPRIEGYQRAVMVSADKMIAVEKYSGTED